MTCEEPYTRYRGAEVQKRLRDYHYDRSRSGYMISGVPMEDIGYLVRELRIRGTYIFVTDLIDHFYESFGPSWNIFLDAMDE